MNDINKVKAIDDHNEPLTKFLKQLEHRIKSNKCEKLLFPAHMKMIKHWHLKQGKIGQLSEVCDKCSVKSIIFEPFMWLEQTYGSIFISTVCLPIVQRWWTNVNKMLLLFLKCVLRYI